MLKGKVIGLQAIKAKSGVNYLNIFLSGEEKDVVGLGCEKIMINADEMLSGRELKLNDSLILMYDKGYKGQAMLKDIEILGASK